MEVIYQMNEDKSNDVYTYHILNRIDPNILNSLSFKQLSAIKDAIRASQPKKKHGVDLRGVIPLYFAKYYFVLIMGRDNRVSTKEIVAERRKYGTVIGNLVFIIFGISPLILLLLGFRYFFMSIPNIDNYIEKLLWNMFKGP